MAILYFIILWKTNPKLVDNVVKIQSSGPKLADTLYVRRKYFLYISRIFRICFVSIEYLSSIYGVYA